jgi:hypothetical protein
VTRAPDDQTVGPSLGRGAALIRVSRPLLLVLAIAVAAIAVGAGVAGAAGRARATVTVPAVGGGEFTCVETEPPEGQAGPLLECETPGSEAEEVETESRGDAPGTGSRSPGPAGPGGLGEAEPASPPAASPQPGGAAGGGPRQGGVRHGETLAAPGAATRDGGTPARPPGTKGGAEEGEERTPAGAPAIGAGSLDGLSGASAISLGRLELPPLLLPVYQACGSEYEIPWQVLAAINKIESGFGTDMGPSSAGAIGPMQFMPATWREDGLDANGDGRKDAWEPFDAICAAARYLHEAGGEADLHRAIFAYNHADWYVAEVLREARNFGALPANLLASLTALAEGETVPVPAATGSAYAAPVASRLTAPGWLTSAPLAAPAGGEGEPDAGALELSAPAGSPVLAVADSAVVKRGRDEALGRYLILRDAYGTRYTYSHLGSIRRVARRPPPASRKVDSTGGRLRLSADPRRRGATEPGSLRAAGSSGPAVALRKGTAVAAGTVIATVAAGPAAGIDFALQPDGSEPVDPRSFVAAWRRGGAGGIFAPATTGATAHKATPDPAETLLLGAARLRRRALRDPLLTLPRCEREGLRAGRVAPRAAAALVFLAASRGERVVLAPQSCAGRGGFGIAVTSVGGHPLSRHGALTPPGREISRQARALQGAMAPQQVRALGSGSAAEALIGSVPAGGAPAPAAAPLELDFSPPQTATLVDGKAVAPVGAPPAVQAMIAAADQISTTPYIWGGGHGSWVAAGYDCSGSVSYVLHAAGLLATPETSGLLAGFGESGAGRWVTIYANATHTYAEIAGLRWDTVGDASGSGPRWHETPPYPEGFAVRHPEGL